MANQCWKTKTFEEENEEDGSIEIHSIGLFNGKSAAIFWLSGLCFITSVLGVSLDNWTQNGPSLFGQPDLGGSLFVSSNELLNSMQFY